MYITGVFRIASSSGNTWVSTFTHKAYSKYKVWTKVRTSNYHSNKKGDRVEQRRSLMLWPFSSSLLLGLTQTCWPSFSRSTSLMWFAVVALFVLLSYILLRDKLFGLQGLSFPLPSFLLLPIWSQVVEAPLLPFVSCWEGKRRPTQGHDNGAFFFAL